MPGIAAYANYLIIVHAKDGYDSTKDPDNPEINWPPTLAISGEPVAEENTFEGVKYLMVSVLEGDRITLFLNADDPNIAVGD